jgi:DNA-binding NarL/FixJ family response regulator
MHKIRVMLVDDHTVVRSGLKLIIQNQADMEVVGEASNPTESLACAIAQVPDVMVLDLSLASGSSLSVIEKLAVRGLPTRVLVLSMHDDPAYVRAALAAGAKGYVVKTISEQDLLQAIRSVNHGRIVVDLDNEERTENIFQTLIHRESGSHAPKLSSREIEVLHLLGRGFTNVVIADRLDVSPKTVATYRARLGEKLGLKTTAEFVKYAANMGLLKPDL